MSPGQSLWASLILCIGAANGVEPTAGETRIEGHPVQLARYGKTYVGLHGVKVELAGYKQGTEEGAIVVIHGVEGDWEGKAIAHRKSLGVQEAAAYSTRWGSTEWTTLRVSGRGDQAELFLPDQTPASLAAADAQPSPRALFDLYQTQQSAGLRPQGPSEAKANAEVQAQVDAATQRTNEACGTHLTFKVDFGSFQPVKNTNRNISGFCAAPLAAMRNLCTAESLREVLRERVRAIECRYSGPGKRAISVTDQTLSFSVDLDAVNNDTFAQRWMEKNF